MTSNSAATCLKKCELVGVLAFATTGKNGEPQIRNISVIHYEADAIYFFTARGKDFCSELKEDGRVQILAYAGMCVDIEFPKWELDFNVRHGVFSSYQEL